MRREDPMTLLHAQPSEQWIASALPGTPQAWPKTPVAQRQSTPPDMPVLCDAAEAKPLGLFVFLSIFMLNSVCECSVLNPRYTP